MVQSPLSAGGCYKRRGYCLKEDTGGARSRIIVHSTTPHQNFTQLQRRTKKNHTNIKYTNTKQKLRIIQIQLKTNTSTKSQIKYNCWLNCSVLNLFSTTLHCFSQRYIRLCWTSLQLILLKLCNAIHHNSLRILDRSVVLEDSSEEQGVGRFNPPLCSTIYSHRHYYLKLYLYSWSTHLQIYSSISVYLF